MRDTNRRHRAETDAYATNLGQVKEDLASVQEQTRSVESAHAEIQEAMTTQLEDFVSRVARLEGQLRTQFSDRLEAVWDEHVDNISTLQGLADRCKDTHRAVNDVEHKAAKVATDISEAFEATLRLAGMGGC